MSEQSTHLALVSTENTFGSNITISTEAAKLLQQSAVNLNTLIELMAPYRYAGQKEVAEILTHLRIDRLGNDPERYVISNLFDPGSTTGQCGDLAQKFAQDMIEHGCQHITVQRGTIPSDFTSKLLGGSPGNHVWVQMHLDNDHSIVLDPSYRKITTPSEDGYEATEPLPLKTIDQSEKILVKASDGFINPRELGEKEADDYYIGEIAGCTTLLTLGMLPRQHLFINMGVSNLAIGTYNLDDPQSPNYMNYTGTDSVPTIFLAFTNNSGIRTVIFHSPIDGNLMCLGESLPDDVIAQVKPCLDRLATLKLPPLPIETET